MAKRSREAEARPLRRRTGIRRPKKTLVVFCEGEKTEPQYLEALKNQPEIRDAAAVDLRIETGHGGAVPLTLVALAILHFKDHGAWLDNDGARRLRRALDGSPGKSLEAAKYMPLVADAARRAADLETRHQKNATVFPHDNPSSGMHRLIASVQPA